MPQNVVSATALDTPANTIAITEFTDYINALYGNGPGGPYIKSHRPSDAYALDAAGTVPYDTSSNMTGMTIYAMSAPAAQLVFSFQPTVPAGDGSHPHIIYVNKGRHTNGNTYTFCDGHSKWEHIESTLNCKSFQWGTHAWNQGGTQVQCPDGSGPVQ
jgi:prepilin-type processing-associated H-X9-DG protein